MEGVRHRAQGLWLFGQWLAAVLSVSACPPKTMGLHGSTVDGGEGP